MTYSVENETVVGKVANALTILLLTPHRTAVGTRIIAQKDFAAAQRLLEQAILLAEHQPVRQGIVAPTPHLR